jgi:prepilin-type N-terminal cleavage/methylation domain-containing protein
MQDRPTPTLYEEGFTLPEILIVVSIVAALALMLLANGAGARQQTNVGICLNNLRTIATAAEQFHTATQKYPAGTNADVNTTLFANPTVTTVSYLAGQPNDPADTTGAATYKYSYTAATATVGEYYTITCPGLHPKETLAGQVPNGASETTGTIQFDSRSAGLKAL